ncbi:MAG: hypothetical protein ACI9HK_005189, partial [Pirellulaceae bacterium]
YQTTLTFGDDFQKNKTYSISVMNSAGEVIAELSASADTGPSSGDGLRTDTEIRTELMTELTNAGLGFSASAVSGTDTGIALSSTGTQFSVDITRGSTKLTSTVVTEDKATLSFPSFEEKRYDIIVKDALGNEVDRAFKTVTTADLADKAAIRTALANQITAGDFSAVVDGDTIVITNAFGTDKFVEDDFTVEITTTLVSAAGTVTEDPSLDARKFVGSGSPLASQGVWRLNLGTSQGAQDIASLTTSSLAAPSTWAEIVTNLAASSTSAYTDEDRLLVFNAPATPFFDDLVLDLENVVTTGSAKLIQVNGAITANDVWNIDLADTVTDTNTSTLDSGSLAENPTSAAVITSLVGSLAVEDSFVAFDLTDGRFTVMQKEGHDFTAAADVQPAGGSTVGTALAKRIDLLGPANLDDTWELSFDNNTVNQPVTATIDTVSEIAEQLAAAIVPSVTVNFTAFSFVGTEDIVIVGFDGGVAFAPSLNVTRNPNLGTAVVAGAPDLNWIQRADLDPAVDDGSGGEVPATVQSGDIWTLDVNGTTHEVSIDESVSLSDYNLAYVTAELRSAIVGGGFTVTPTVPVNGVFTVSRADGSIVDVGSLTQFRPNAFEGKSVLEDDDLSGPDPHFQRAEIEFNRQYQSNEEWVVTIDGQDFSYITRPGGVNARSINTVIDGLVGVINRDQDALIASRKGSRLVLDDQTTTKSGVNGDDPFTISVRIEGGAARALFDIDNVALTEDTAFPFPSFPIDFTTNMSLELYKRDGDGQRLAIAHPDLLAGVETQSGVHVDLRTEEGDVFQYQLVDFTTVANAADTITLPAGANWSDLGVVAGQVLTIRDYIYDPTVLLEGNVGLVLVESIDANVLRVNDTSNLSFAVTSLRDNGSLDADDPMLEYIFTEPGDYVLKVGSYFDYNFDDNYGLYYTQFSTWNPFADGVKGVAVGQTYDLLISLPNHATNQKAITLSGKEITVLDGDGKGLDGAIVAYDAEINRYVIAVNGATDADNWSSQVKPGDSFEITFDPHVEFATGEAENLYRNRSPVIDSYDVILTGRPAVAFSGELEFHSVANGADTIRRIDGGSWSDDGFAVGQTFTVGSSNLNSGSYAIAGLDGDVLAVGVSVALQDETTEAVLTAILDATFTDEITFDAASRTLQRTTGSWSDSGFAAGQTITVANSTKNDRSFEIASVSGNILTVVEGPEVKGEPNAANVTVDAVVLVVLDARPISTRTLDSEQAFNPDLNFGENKAVQVNVATERLFVELDGSIPVAVSFTGDVDFDGTNNTITRTDGGSWRDVGFALGQTFSVADSSNNDNTYQIVALSEDVLTVSSDGTLQTEADVAVQFTVDVSETWKLILTVENPAANAPRKLMDFEFDVLVEPGDTLSDIAAALSANIRQNSAGLFEVARVGEASLLVTSISVATNPRFFSRFELVRDTQGTIETSVSLNDTQ